MTVKSPVTFFRSYQIYYPTAWTIKEYKNTPETDDSGFSILNLTKGSVSLKITQGAGDAGGCLFPEDPEKEGMYSKYGNYREILNDYIVWRWAPRLDNTQVQDYSVCALTSNGFVSSTSIGYISITGNDIDAQTLDEINYILEKIIIE